MIEIDKLTRYFGAHRAVDIADLHVEAGQVVVLLGRIGAGKSTLLRLLAGYLMPSSGGARIAGVDLVRARVAAQRKLGYVPQAASFYDEMRVHDFLRFIAALRGLRGMVRDRRIGEVGELLRLEAVMGESLGRLQPDSLWRVRLAQAILHEPPVLLLDEPGAGLDDRQRREMLAILDAYARSRSVLVCSREPATALAGCDRVAVMHRGRLLALATPAQLLARSRYHGAVSFTAAHAAVARQALARVAGASTIETDPRSGRTTVFALPGAAILDGVMHALATLEVGYSEIQLERGRLVDVLDGMVAKEEARVA